MLKDGNLSMTQRKQQGLMFTKIQTLEHLESQTLAALEEPNALNQPLSKN
jgi:hypothetical protein